MSARSARPMVVLRRRALALTVGQGAWPPAWPLWRRRLARFRLGRRVYEMLNRND
ncbi:hypothetical protein GCM10009609_13860 [Pseudonocardia aurantiaca]